MVRLLSLSSQVPQGCSRAQEDLLDNQLLTVSRLICLFSCLPFSFASLLPPARPLFSSLGRIIKAAFQECQFQAYHGGVEATECISYLWLCNKLSQNRAAHNHRCLFAHCSLVWQFGLGAAGQFCWCLWVSCACSWLNAWPGLGGLGQPHSHVCQLAACWLSSRWPP